MAESRLVSVLTRWMGVVACLVLSDTAVSPLAGQPAASFGIAKYRSETEDAAALWLAGLYRLQFDQRIGATASVQVNPEWIYETQCVLHRCNPERPPDTYWELAGAADVELHDAASVFLGPALAMRRYRDSSYRGDIFTAGIQGGIVSNIGFITLYFRGVRLFDNSGTWMIQVGPLWSF